MQVDKRTSNVQSMFDSIAYRYDFLNHFLSLGIDRRWRKKVRKKIQQKANLKILDIATGTGDLAIEMSKLNPKIINGIDISSGMVNIGKKKVIKKKLGDQIKLQIGDSQNIQFSDQTFDVVTCAFGVRNFENLSQGLSEMHRVLCKNGQVIILEFSESKNKRFSVFFNFYFRRILPTIGKIISKNKKAYNYLPDSVAEFPCRDNFLDILSNIGFKFVKYQKLSFGVANIYTAKK